jgi:hypothetical protein
LNPFNGHEVLIRYHEFNSLGMGKKEAFQQIKKNNVVLLRYGDFLPFKEDHV